MKVLLSIKPEFANKIFAGTKKYEFRRTIFKNCNVKKVLVYSSSPVQRVIGEFEIELIMSDNPMALWNETKNESGITRDYFFQYFVGKTCGHAIKIKSPVLYKKPKSLWDDFNMRPPQSFLYLS